MTKSHVTHFVSVSGGKDSAATAAFVRDAGIVASYIFADTGHEHPLTLKYLDYLETIFGPIKRVKADFTRQMQVRRRNLQKFWGKDGIAQSRIDRAKQCIQPTGIPMLDLAILKGRFPSTRARFCTQELKVIPIIEQCYMPAIRVGETVFSWQGIRADESRSRAKLPRISVEEPGIFTVRPLMSWNAATVFNFLAAHQIRPNPLYLNGMSRVGCMPCIMANKGELKSIATRYPEEFERLAEWEAIVKEASKRGVSTFFAADKTPGTEDTRSNAMAVKEWAMTEHGGRQYSVLAPLDDVPVCSSVYGLCE